MVRTLGPSCPLEGTNFPFLCNEIHFTWWLGKLTSTFWNMSMCTCYLGYFSKIYLLSPFIYFCNHSLYQEIFMYFYFILWVIIWNYVIYFVANFLPDLDIGNSLAWLLFPFDIPLILLFLSTFLHFVLQEFQAHLVFCFPQSRINQCSRESSIFLLEIGI